LAGVPKLDAVRKLLARRLRAEPHHFVLFMLRHSAFSDRAAKRTGCRLSDRGRSIARDAVLVAERDVPIREFPGRPVISGIADAGVDGDSKHLLDRGLRLVPEFHPIGQVLAFQRHRPTTRWSRTTVVRLAAASEAVWNSCP